MRLRMRPMWACMAPLADVSSSLHWYSSFLRWRTLDASLGSCTSMILPHASLAVLQSRMKPRSDLDTVRIMSPRTRCSFCSHWPCQ